MIQNIIKFFVNNKDYIINKLYYLLIAIVFILAISTYLLVTEEKNLSTPDPDLVIKVVLADLVALLTLCVLLGRKLIKHWYSNELNNKNKLYNQISLMCALVSFAPTVIISIFSTYFFNFGIQSWFDQRINNVLVQSVYVAEAYMLENNLRMQETAASIRADLSELTSTPKRLAEQTDIITQFLNAQDEFRSLNESIIFQKDNKTIIAQSDLSFSLSFIDIDEDLIAKADEGHIINLNINKNKIQYLIKLFDEDDDIYLIIGKFLDQNILNYSDKTNGAISSYNELKGKSHILQINFSIAFILVALILLLASFYIGLLFADKIVKPINNLVLATEKVKKGDLTIQVDLGGTNNEINTLINAFNIMIKRLDYQQKDLLIAQRALAWSEVARRVAHEIKNPLTSIYLSCERLSKKFTQEVNDTENFQKYIKNIFRLSQNINTILSEFVNFARLPEPVFNKLELVSFIQDIIESRSLVFENIQYKFNSNIPNLIFNGDKDQINQVLINLLKNSEESILENNRAEKWITISLYQTDQLIVLELIDSGVGFNLSDINKTTEAYFTTRTKGTGLGLAIVKKIIQDHKGQLNIENNEYGGAKITIRFDN